MSAQLALAREPDGNTIVLDGEVPARSIWPIAGGKGGTGKSTLTANLGLGLSLLGYKVILVDGDLGGADLHLFFGQLSPPRSLSSFLLKEAATLEQVVVDTPSENLRLVCGGNELIGIANLPYLVKEKLVRHILALDADYVLIDLGAGTSYNTLDLFTMSDHGVVVCTPEPHARVDAYGFVKNTVYRKLRRRFAGRPAVRQVIDRFATGTGRRSGRIRELVEQIAAVDPRGADDCGELLDAYRPRLVLNRVRHRRQLQDSERLLSLVEDYLSVRMEYVGHVRNDPHIMDACERRRPLLLDSPKAPAARDICSILMKGLAVQDRLHRYSADDSRKMAEAARAEARFW
ncbi:MAG: P-loop NTPase [Candidatus Latescibacterota bacterium]